MRCHSFYIVSRGKTTVTPGIVNCFNIVFLKSVVMKWIFFISNKYHTVWSLEFTNESKFFNPLTFDFQYSNIICNCSSYRLKRLRPKVNCFRNNTRHISWYFFLQTCIYRNLKRAFKRWLRKTKGYTEQSNVSFKVY